ncbi:MAG: Maf family nucleotide pyrophosphatase [Xanthomonadales bacterium]|jgi:septum formation protein|nr:Maf family nucleotide pyrophosphatase [Xanthomonadales bacterium]
MSDASTDALPALLLASTSRYRRELLGRLQLPFVCLAPGVDESERAEEAPRDRARRLAEAKARAVAVTHPAAAVIGSDQVCECRGLVLDKPGTLARARQMLDWMSGETVRFHTAVSLIHGRQHWHQVDRTVCRVRRLDAAAIDAYLAREPSLDTAGAFKIEGLGISLFSAVHSRDPSALIGLPLIWLSARLRRLRFPV